jgi:Ca-activated chloride channel homolog
MSFAAPWMLLFLLAVPLAVGLHVLAGRRRKRYPVRFPALAVLAEVAPTGPDWRKIAPVGLMALALASLAVALAKPERTVALPVERASVVLVTDVSRSMQATDVSPSRLEAARNAAKKFVGRVPKELRVGLVAFSNSGDLLQSPTTDHGDVESALDTLAPVEGTATGAGLRSALEALRPPNEKASKRAPAAIVLLSDGSATDGDAAYVAAAEAKRLKVPIYTVALGTESGTVTLPGGATALVPPDPEALARIARASGGKAFQAEDADQLSGVYEKLGSQIGTKKGKREVTAAFAGAALVLLLGAAASQLRWGARLP